MNRIIGAAARDNHKRVSGIHRDPPYDLVRCMGRVYSERCNQMVSNLKIIHAYDSARPVLLATIVTRAALWPLPLIQFVPSFPLLGDH